MTRPDVFGLARAITEDAAQGDDYRDDCTCSLCEETRCLRATATFRIAAALLALEPLLDALDVWRTTKPNYAQIRAVRHLIAMHDTARAALGRETT